MSPPMQTGQWSKAVARNSVQASHKAARIPRAWATLFTSMDTGWKEAVVRSWSSKSNPGDDTWHMGILIARLSAGLENIFLTGPITHSQIATDHLLRLTTRCLFMFDKWWKSTNIMIGKNSSKNNKTKHISFEAYKLILTIYPMQILAEKKSLA